MPCEGGFNFIWLWISELENSFLLKKERLVYIWNNNNNKKEYFYFSWVGLHLSYNDIQ